MRRRNSCLRMGLWLAAAVLAAAPCNAEILVSGRLQAPGGEPLAEAPVRLLPARDSHRAGLDLLAGRAEPEPADEALTGEDGRFELRAPEAGLWEVRAAPEGFVPMRVRLRPLVEPTRLPAVELRRGRPLTVMVLDPAGKPVAGAMTTARTKNRRMWFPSTPSRNAWLRVTGIAFTDDDGRATLPLAENESVDVRAFAPGFAPAESTASSGGRLDLRLREGRAATVAVSDAAGRPVGGALVVLGGDWWSAGVTDPDGRLDATLPEDRIVRALTAAGASGQVRAANDADSVAVTLSDREVVTGTVIDAETRSPIAGALVWSVRATAAIARSDAAGRFRLATIHHAGVSHLQASAPGHFPERLQVSSGQDFEPVLALRPAAEATGEVVNAGGEPVAGADLVARVLPGSQAGFRHVDEAHTISGEDGRFRFTSLTPGLPLQVEALAAGYAPVTLDLDSLAPRESRGGLRLVVTRGASLVGRVFGAGEPVAGAELAILGQPAGSTPMAILARMEHDKRTETTDGEGAFEVHNLAPGAYRLEISAPGHATLVVPGVQVEAGGADLGTLELEPGVEITGTVVDAAGRPVAGAEVHASSPESQVFPLPRRGGESQAPAMSGADGRFVVPDRRRGERIDLQISHSDYQPTGVSGVEAPNPVPLRIVLTRAARVTGTVVDPTGEPVDGAVVLVMMEEAEPTRATIGVRGFTFPVNGRTDDGGRFEIDQVPSGRVRITASAQGWRAAELSSLEVAPGETLEGLRLVLESGATVAGRVLDGDGRPVIGAMVRVEEQSGSLVRFERPSMATTGGDGRYLLEGVEPGLQLLVARDRDGARAAREIEVAPGVNQLDLRIAGGHEISGRVVDGGGAPVAGASITAIAEARDWRGAEARSGDDGGFTIAGVRDGQYRLRVTREGYATRLLDEPLQVAGAPLGGVEIVLMAGGSIRGALLGVAADQIPAITVMATSGDSQWAIGQVSHDGSYRIPDLAPGEWNVQALIAQGAVARGQVSLADGAAVAVLDLEFGSGVTLTGQVRRAGQAAAGLMVQVSGLDVASGFVATTDHQGRFRIVGLEAGRYRLEVADFTGGMQHREELEIDGDRDVVVEISSGRVGGRVLDAEDRSPLAGAVISLEPIDSESAQGFVGRPWMGSIGSNAEGRFAIPSMAAGGYRLKVVKDGYAPAEQAVTVAPEGNLDVEVLLEPTSGLRLVVRGASGSPVGEIDFAVLDAGGGALATGRRPVDDQGRVRLLSVPTGSFELLLSAPGAAVHRLRGEAPGPPIIVRLEPACRLEVGVPALAEDTARATMRVTGSDGVPFIEVLWGTVRREWPLYGGAHTLSGLPAGSYNVEVTTPDGRRWQGSVGVSPGATTRLEM